jgi:hypothetical protein
MSIEPTHDFPIQKLTDEHACRCAVYLRVGLHRLDTEHIDSDLKARLEQAQNVDGLFQIV